jgi:molecular chaperone GrpE
MTHLDSDLTPSEETLTPDSEGYDEGDMDAAGTDWEVTVTAMRDHIAELSAELDHLKDQNLRAVAEAQNVQRRLRQQMELDRKYAAEPLARELIPALDNLARSLAAAEKGASLEALLNGVRTVERQLLKALEGVGVQRVSSVGQMFDPEIHEALATVETADLPADTVTDELEAGYVLHDRLLRPARVRVSVEP